ncbi:hypothetical protein FOCG_17706 [Fusarium oxysporum f. sp. radicis-lycopersici 26381]|nr:hypothetical protein FOCG_17706 [Fusarium oxysporum f. sp. radicis-lycopersici 26381]
MSPPLLDSYGTSRGPSAFSESRPPDVRQPSTLAPTSDEERRIFLVWKGLTLAERSKDSIPWVWNYGIEIQSKSSRIWICMPCVRQKTPTLQSYESKCTQNAELHLWNAHGYWDPSGRRSTPSEKKGGKRVHASISDFMNLKRFHPKEQVLANSLIKRFDPGEFQKLIVNWRVESQQSFKPVEHPRLQQNLEYLNPAVKVTSARITAKTSIAAEILEIIKSFSIEDKVGYFTVDNAANNETAMSEITEDLKFDPVQRRVLCMGHIFNIVVKSILFGKDADTFEKSLVKEPLTRAARNQWMRKGPVGKAHNFVVSADFNSR